jgi:hypothetical protein
MDMSAEAGDTSAADSSDPDTDAPTTSTYVRPTCIASETGDATVPQVTPPMINGNSYAYNRRVKQEESDWVDLLDVFESETGVSLVME